MQLNDYEKKHIEMLRPYLPECCVLLRHKGDFPLESLNEVALYGSGVRDTIKGGTGSGEVNSRYYDTVEMAFEKAGIKITTKDWLDAYDKVVADAEIQFKKELKQKAKELHTQVIMLCFGATMPTPEYNLPINGEGNVAIYVLSRDSGEGADREAVKGQVYLTDTEIRDIKAINEKYEHFMLVLNVGGVVDLSPLSDVENILILSQLGVETGDALVDIILGKANPSGKLSTTWAAFSDYSKLIDFEGYDDTNYKEGIYVGYRYFDTVDVKPIFPFGYGLSYTTFEIGKAVVANSKSKIEVKVSVKNTGNFAGKEVIQVYVSVPDGKMNTPYQALAAYAKTSELAPGESETVVATFDMASMAVFDEEKAYFILEKGDYVVRVGNSSRNTVASAVINLQADIVTKQVRNCLGKPGFDEYIPEKKCKITDDEIVDGGKIYIFDSDFTLETVEYDKEYEISDKAKAMSDDDLLLLAMGHFKQGGVDGVVGNAGTTVAGTAGETAHVKGVKPLIMSDGPAGLRIAKDIFFDKKGVHGITPPLPESMLRFAPGYMKFAMNFVTPKAPKGTEIKHQYCTAIPIGTAIAQSFNDEFAEICGDVVGAEMDIFDIDLWLAPALNIHRSILCGRNFEYYSEDPLVSGKMAAGITRGVQKHPGRYVTIKHFAANNQEFNRTSCSSNVSERAMREIYLRGFEICVKESNPGTVMSSYNLINGVHTSTRSDLLNDILRSEFGFKGFVMTDWIIMGGQVPKDAKYKGLHPADIAAAGNDVFMPGSKRDFKMLVEGFKAGRVTRKQLEINATRVMSL